MRYRYPRHENRNRNEHELHITLHAENLIETFDKCGEYVSILSRFREEPTVKVVMTPSRPEQQVPEELQKVTQVRYEKLEVRPGSKVDFMVVIESSLYSHAVCAWDSEMAVRIFGYPSDDPRNEHVLRAFKDLEAHRALDADIFVTEDRDVLAFRDWIQRRIPILILNVCEALDYLDVHLKREGRYLYTPIITVEGKRLYYWERLCKLIPVLQKTWAVAAIAAKSASDGEQVKNYLHSLSMRLIYMLEAKDKIASQFYQRADNKVQYEMLRELNYFMTLTTGSFDALAWVFKYIYRFQPTKSEEDREFRQSVVLKLREGKTTNGLINHVEGVNKNLGAYLRSKATQDFMSIFYPSRDSIQHRHPMGGAHYIRATIKPGNRPYISREEEDTAYSLAVLDNDTEQAISKLDSDDTSDYFTRWGVRKAGGMTFLEPYKFTVEALMRFADFCRQALELLDISNRYSLAQADLARLEEIHRKQCQPGRFLIPFLLQNTLPPLSPIIPRLPASTSQTSAESKADDSIALYGTYPLFLELLGPSESS